jgi:hypothetical protein
MTRYVTFRDAISSGAWIVCDEAMMHVARLLFTLTRVQAMSFDAAQLGRCAKCDTTGILFSRAPTAPTNACSNEPACG